jgi:hypothetical protein
MPRKKSKKLIEVIMGDVVFTSDTKTSLITEGVTTCIAIIVQGSFWDEEHDEINFCGLYHWSGFGPSAIEQDKQAHTTFLYFLEKLRYFAGIEDDMEINIDSLQFIGGEKEQRDIANEIIISGSEAEVNSLKKAVNEFDFEKYFFNIDPKVISHQHFLTTGEQSISIELTVNDCHFKMNNPSPTEPLVSDLSTAVTLTV